jgi:hypothetical protein
MESTGLYQEGSFKLKVDQTKSMVALKRQKKARMAFRSIQTSF